ATRTVASLAIDTFRNTARKHGFSPRLIALRWNVRNAVVTRHARVGDGACEAGMIRAIIAGIHRPRPTVFRIPRKRKFHESVAARPMEERTHMVARTHHKVDFFLEAVRLFAVETDLVAPLVKSSVPLDHREVTIGGFVEEGDEVFLITDCIAGRRPAK